ncbi:30S ribosomal protein S7 [Histoplasma capsulatum]|uniref:Small ribosomal subunit protein uS7m n=1 Tax=Ajellomyces capsulatus TaxID=5037 RepID=A0A8A1MJM3_AJECA|nr:30S ribosomal protein S7 [Histoplasma capsulatum]
MPPRLNLLPTAITAFQSQAFLPYSSLLRPSTVSQQCTASRSPSLLSSSHDRGIRALSTKRDLLLRQRGGAVLAHRPCVSSSQRRMESSSSKAGAGIGEGKAGRIADEKIEAVKRSESEAAKEGLGSVSEEAAELARIMERRTECGEVGEPELSQGSMVGDILKRDKDALKNAPKVLRDQLSSSSSSSSSGSRSFSTSARSRQLHMNQISPVGENDALIAAATERKYDQARREGLKFDVPETLPRSEHLKHRYDPLLDQFTKMLMRHGKLSAAQKQMDAILHNLRSAPAPNIDPSRPLLPGPPSPQLPLNPILYLTLVVDSVAPLLRIKQQPGAAGGGRSLPIPLPLALRQRRRTAIKWIIDASEKRKDAALANRVAQEIIAVAEGKSSVWDKRGVVHKQGTASRANIKALGMKGRKKF